MPSLVRSKDEISSCTHAGSVESYLQDVHENPRLITQDF